MLEGMLRPSDIPVHDVGSSRLLLTRLLNARLARRRSGTLCPLDLGGIQFHRDAPPTQQLEKHPHTGTACQTGIEDGLVPSKGAVMNREAIPALQAVKHFTPGGSDLPDPTVNGPDEGLRHRGRFAPDANQPAGVGQILEDGRPHGSKISFDKQVAGKVGFDLASTRVDCPDAQAGIESFESTGAGLLPRSFFLIRLAAECVPLCGHTAASIVGKNRGPLRNPRLGGQRFRSQHHTTTQATHRASLGDKALIPTPRPQIELITSTEWTVA